MMPPGVTKTCSKTEYEIRTEAAARVKLDVAVVLAVVTDTMGTLPTADTLFRVAMNLFGHHFHTIEADATTYNDAEVAQHHGSMARVRHTLSSVPHPPHDTRDDEH